MSYGRIPGPYVDEVKEDDTLMIYDYNPGWGVMDIGARKSGQPEVASDGPRPLVHVGGNRRKAGERNG